MDLPAPKNLLPGSLRRALAPAVRFLLRPRSRYVLAWLFALAVAAGVGYSCLTYYNDDRRPDGNAGHRSIDFGGQWLMGRMLADGCGRHLYDRNYQREVLLRHFPASNQDPKAKQGDVEWLMESFMGEDSPARPRVLASFLVPLAAPNALGEAALVRAGQDYWTAGRLDEVTAKQVGGPLYPPINALFTYPLALIEPHTAYRLDQVLNLVLAFACGLAVSRLTRGAVWWPIAATLIMGYPGFAGSCNLGQNATLSLTMLVGGWVLLAGGRPGWGGAVWGLLAYKPVWALSFFLALAVTRRWRACLAMLATGAALALATLPLVGLASWFDWLKVGKEAAGLYNVSERWINLSRDLLGIPRRWLLDFTIEPARDRDTSWLVHVLGWGLMGTVAALTAALAWRRRDQAQSLTGPPPAYVLLGAWLCGYHFMYYDVLLTALPLFLLTAALPRYYLRVVLAPLPGRGPPEEGESEPAAASSPRGAVSLYISNRTICLALLAVLIGIQLVVAIVQWGHAYGVPFDTFFLIGVWLGCGWVWLRTPPPPARDELTVDAAGFTTDVPGRVRGRRADLVQEN
jgi:hypothetical protein